MTPTLLLVHGWGYDAAFWDRLLARLPLHTAYRAEAGYRGAMPDWPSVPDGTLAIGHSAGVPALLARLPRGCIGLVAINGFTRFVAAPGFAGVSDRLPARMLARLDTDPDGTVRDFHARCASATGSMPADVPRTPRDAERHDPHAGVSSDRLRLGLQALRGADPRDQLAGLDLPVLALSAEDDPVVVPAHARACFSAGSLRWSETGGHLLPLTHPDWCANQIAGFPC